MHKAARSGSLVLATSACVGLAVATATVEAARARPGEVLAPFLVVLVGCAWLLAAALAPGTRLCRLTAAAVGGSWLVASWMPGTVLVHQGLLLLLLVGFPRGRPQGWPATALAVGAAPVAAVVVPQWGVALLFAAAAVVTVHRLRSWPASRWYPFVTSTAVAAALASAWVGSRAWSDFDPPAALTAYELVLVGGAVLFGPALRAAGRERRHLADRLLSDGSPMGVHGLSLLLAEVLHDEALTVVRPYDAGWAADPAPSAAAGGRRQRRLVVFDDSRAVAAVLHRSALLDDPAVGEGVAASVRLFVAHDDQQQELRARADALRAARGRLLTAVDSERDAMAARLREDVVAPLRSTVSRLAAEVDLQDPARSDPAAVAVASITGALRDIDRLIAGVPSSELGGGRLRRELEGLASHSGLPVTVAADPAAAAEAGIEAALFYVCSEALANAVKHSGAQQVQVRLDHVDRALRLTVTDDGRGGADPCGSGLLGLTDRLAALGGHPQVDSPLGKGTTLTASVPS